VSPLEPRWLDSKQFTPKQAICWANSFILLEIAVYLANQSQYRYQP
jgi:hypothetical protein